MSNKTKSARDFIYLDMAPAYPKSATAHIRGLCAIVESQETTIRRLYREKAELYEALDNLLNSISYNELEGYRTDKPALDFVEILGLAEQALKKARGEQ